MAKISPPKRSSKGAPPTTLQVVENLDKPEAGDLKTLTFKVPPDFHREFKMYAVMHGMDMKELLMKSFERFREAQDV